MAVVGVVPAAGYARRLQPFPHSKEVHPVRGRPVMSYLMERMRVAGADEIRVVTRPAKSDVTRSASEQGAVVIHAHPKTVSASLVVGMKGLEEDDVVLLGFPDTVWQPREGFMRLLAALTHRQRVVLGLFETGEPERSDIVEIRASGLITGVQVKPNNPRSLLLWGCAAGEVGVLRGMRDFAEPGYFFDWLAKREPIAGVRLSDRWIDIGTRLTLERGAALAEDREGPL